MIMGWSLLASLLTSVLLVASNDTAGLKILLMDMDADFTCLIHANLYANDFP